MVQIREAKPSDAVFIADFQIKMAKETEDYALDPEIVKPGVEAVFRDVRRGKYYVAEMDGHVVGSLLTTYEWSDWRNGTVLWIQSVFILKEHRGKGIYKKLYAHVKDLVLNGSEFKGIRLYVDKTNLPARQVYQKLGMINHHYDLFEWMRE